LTNKVLSISGIGNSTVSGHLLKAELVFTAGRLLEA